MAPCEAPCLITTQTELTISMIREYNEYISLAHDYIFLCVYNVNGRLIVLMKGSHSRLFIHIVMCKFVSYLLTSWSYCLRE